MKKSLAFLSALSFATAGFAADPADAPGLKMTGFMQYRYEWTENPRAVAEDSYAAAPSGYGNGYIDGKSNERLNLFLFLDNHFDGKTRFHAILGGEHLSGRTTRTNLDIKEAYLAAKFGPAEIAVGRYLPVDVPIGVAPYMDGLRVSVINDTVSGVAYLTKFGNAFSKTIYSPSNVGSDYSDTLGVNGHMTFAMGAIRVKPVSGLTLGVAYIADLTTDDADNNYKTYTLSAEYKYVSNNVPWFTVSADYSKNNSDGAKGLNLDTANGKAENPIAYQAKVKVLGAHPFMPGTGGFHVQYRKAESGFDIMGLSNPDVWNTPFNWTTPSGGGMAENHKGIEVGAEVTVLPRTILKAAYGFMKSDSSTTVAALYAHPVGGTMGAPSTDKENYFTASVFYLF